MRYVTIYAKSPAAGKKLKWIQTLFPLAWVAMMIAAIIPSFAKYGHFDTDLYPMFGLMIVGLAFATFIMRYKFRQLLNTVFEINEIGIQNLTPGKEQTIRWMDLVSVKIVQANKNQRGLLLKTADAKMMIWQPLVPDIEDGTVFKQTLMGTKEIRPDGTSDVFRLENSYPVRELKKYRPDLAEKFLARPVANFLSKIFGPK